MTNLLLTVAEFFKKAFLPIKTSFNWDFFFGILGTYLGVVSLISNKQKRGFELRQGDTFYKTKLADNMNGKIKLLYKGEYVENLISTVIFLQNTGNVELKNDDFNNDCILEFSEKVHLLEYTIDSSDKFTLIKSKFEENKLYLTFSFIEPKEYVKIEILYKSSELPDAKMSINMVRGERKICDLKDYSRVEHEVGKSKDSSFLLVWTSICIGILIGIAFVFAKTLNIQILDKDMNIGIPYGWASLFLIVAFFPAFIIWNKVYSQLTFVKKNWFDVKEWSRIEYFEN